MSYRLPARHPAQWIAAILIVLSASGCAYGRADVHVSSLAGLQTAIDNAPAGGETITLAEGVYRQSEPVRIDGRHDLLITGATDDAADTVLQGPGIDDPQMQINIRLDNADDITLRNLSLVDSYYHGVQINNDSDDFTADNLVTRDNGESGFKVTSPTNASGPAAYSDNGTIENSDIGFTSTGARGEVEGVDIVAGSGWQVRGNHFDHIRRANGGPAYAAFAKGNAQNTVFARNTVENSFIGLSFGGGGTGKAYFRNADSEYETRGGRISDNVIAHVDDAGIYMNKAEDFVVDDNTVIDNGANTGAIEARYPHSSGAIRDNRTSGPIKLRDGANATRSGNQTIAADTPVPNPH